MSKIDIDKFVASLLKAPKGWNEWAIDSEDIKKALADQHLEYKDGEIVSTVYVSGNYSLSVSNTKLGTITGGGTYTIPIEPQSNEKQGKPKQEWSEEDENYLQSAENACEYQYGKNTPTILWLKSLKNRIQPQPKQEWNEEDEEMAEDLIKGCVSPEKEHHLFHTSKEIAEWLKSLKDRMQGKEEKK